MKKIIFLFIVMSFFFIGNKQALTSEKEVDELLTLGLVLGLNSCWSPQAEKKDMGYFISYIERKYPGVKERREDNPIFMRYAEGIALGLKICRYPEQQKQQFRDKLKFDVYHTIKTLSELEHNIICLEALQKMNSHFPGSLIYMTHELVYYTHHCNML
ncbi:hypothetical protein [Cyanobacterium aponinum]|uniref:hypothetical protein n=1 Tax=Cyanobacterium aponinum TaxID=379064 RepID=UPI000C12C2E5|nr:hypothetical protein [Cyanobacterium aponinum]PHV64285.1 hypothetical protein CSQ80_00225 [Cyanobacterium aponinum IPPAS B-1201]